MKLGYLILSQYIKLLIADSEKNYSIKSQMLKYNIKNVYYKQTN